MIYHFSLGEIIKIQIVYLLKNSTAGTWHEDSFSFIDDVKEEITTDNCYIWYREDFLKKGTEPPKLKKGITFHFKSTDSIDYIRSKINGRLSKT